MGRFIVKRTQERKPSARLVRMEPSIVPETKPEEPQKNKIAKKKENMMNPQEKAARIEEILQNQEENKGRVKRVKKDKGLIERTESSKVILTEDNKQLLND
jgi:glucose/arabinose dehydrogenase